MKNCIRHFIIVLGVISLIAMMVGIALAQDEANVATARFVPGSAGHVELDHDSLAIVTNAVYDTVYFTITRPDENKAYFEVFPPLGTVFVDGGKTIHIQCVYEGTDVGSESNLGLYGLEVNGGWQWLPDASTESSPSRLSVSYTINDEARRLIYNDGRYSVERGVYRAFKVDKLTP